MCNLSFRYSLDIPHAFHISRPLFEAAQKQPDDKKLANWMADNAALQEVIAESLTQAEWAQFSKDLYWAFWRYRMYDIHVPKEQYTEYLARLKNDIRTAQATVSNPPYPRDSRTIRKAKRLLDGLKKVGFKS